MSEHPIIAKSNGHRWFEYGKYIACADCGIIRRSDDKNKPCKGKVRVELRTDKDVCECGDYRDQHRDGTGPCAFNKPGNIGHLGAPNCDEFRLSERHE